MEKKQKQTAAKSKSTAQKDYAEADRQERADLKRRVRELLAIQKQFATAIIATGVFSSDSEVWTSAIGDVAFKDAKEALRSLEAVDHVQIQDPGQKGQTVPVCEVLPIVMNAYGDAGFLVGLAVGMKLGPNAFAFDGGVR